MICSECGEPHNLAQFAEAKKTGCLACGNKWFYSDNIHNREKVQAKIRERNNHDEKDLC